MKNCDWCLLLGNEKIFNIRQLRENFDTAVLVGYYLGGGLEHWLSDADERAVLEKVRAMDRSKDIGTQLEFIFGVRPDPKPEAEYSAAEQYEISENTKTEPSAVSANPALASSNNPGFIFSSYRHAFEWEFEKGSFRKANLKFTGGSFGRGSFRLINYPFGTGSFRTVSGLRGSFHGSFRPTSGGSFRFYMGGAEITHEEYKRTHINLSSCPLNEYGYGIHRI